MSASPLTVPTRSRSAGRGRSRLMTGCAVAVALAATAQAPRASAQLNPEKSFQGTGSPTSGVASIVQSGTKDTITINSPQVVIDWKLDNEGGSGPITFLPEGRIGLFQNGETSNFVVLNRIVPTDQTRAIRFDGTVQSRINVPGAGQVTGGSVWFYSPGGIIAGSTAMFDVGSLVLTANDVDTNGGLFGSKGEIRFRGAAGSQSAIQIDPGARIQALTQGSYVALVAPRIAQGGNVRVDGSVGYVAAEAADVTINNGLFDISFITGTTAKQAIVHTGRTDGPASTGAGDNHAIYMATIAKNDAVSMLLGGAIGYDPASVVGVQNGVVVLSAGYNVSGGAIGGPVQTSSSPETGTGHSSIAIDASNFSSRVEGYATDTIAVQPTSDFGSVSFQSDAYLSAVNSVDVGVSGSQRIVANGSLTLQATGTGDGKQRALLFAASNETGYGGGISIGGNLTVDASGRGGGSNSVGGAATVSVDNNNLSVTGNTVISADGFGGFGDTGGDGKGGGAQLLLSAGGSATLGSVAVTANGRGGNSDLGNFPGTGPGGAGTGGAAQVLLTGGSTLTAQALTVGADGQGGMAGIGGGGDGVGGFAELSLTGGSAQLSGLTVSATATGGRGGEALNGPGGDATGGTARVTVNGGSLRPSFSLNLRAGATSGNGTVSGIARGGTVNLTATGGGSIETGYGLDLDASASAGIGIDAAGSATGGGIILSADGASISAGRLSASAYADTMAEGFGDTPSGQGTNALGGSITLIAANGGNISLSGPSGTSDLRVEGYAGASSKPETGGTGTGGLIFVRAVGGTLNLGDTINLNANGVAGMPVAGDGTTAVGLGGTVNVDVGNDGTGNVGSLGFGQMTINADGRADFGREGSFATTGSSTAGGRISFNVTGGSVTGTNLSASADGIGARGASDGFTAGTGTGGINELSVSGGNLTIGEVNLTANGFGGDGSFDSDTAPGSGGAGVGGTTRLTLTGGTYTTSVATTLSASGLGGNGGGAFQLDGGQGGSGSGGLAEVVVGANANVTIPDLAVVAGGQGGQGGDVSYDSGSGYDFSNNAGGGGDATGGTARISLAGDPTLGAIDIGASTANASALAGDGGRFDGFAPFAPVAAAPNVGRTGARAVLAAAPGSSGAATGGTASITISGDATSFGDANVIAEASAGRGADGAQPGDGGTATGGSATLTISDANYTANNIRISAAARGGSAGSNPNIGLGNGGGATGGNALLQVTGAGTTATISELTGVDASARSGSGAVGGLATGGTARAIIGGGSFRTGSATIEASGYGGDGGFAFEGDAGSGGDGVGGTAGFTVASGARILIGGQLTVLARGIGGNGGDVGYGSFDYAFGNTTGAGGNGTGGIATADLAGVSGATDALIVTNTIVVDSSAKGGDGGTHFFLGGNFDAPLAPRGRIGLLAAGGPSSGGSATGGTATLTVSGNGVTIGGSNNIDGVTFFYGGASVGGNAVAGNGGTGAAGSIGGSGGVATGGSATFNVVDADLSIRQVDVTANATAGRGNYSYDGAGGDGGNATGGSATILAQGAATDLVIGNFTLTTDATGGSGGGQSRGSSSVNVGIGGSGKGGTSEVRTELAKLSFDNSSFGGTGPGTLYTISANGTGGRGGDNDGSFLNPGGAGGNGGAGTGGTARIAANGGTVLGFDFQLDANGYGGEGGFGINTALDGNGGTGTGGTGQIRVQDIGNNLGLIQLGAVTMNANGVGGESAANGIFGPSTGGFISLRDESQKSDGSLLLASLNAQATSFDGNGFELFSNNGAVQIAGNATINVGGTVRIDAIGSGGLRVGGTLGISTFSDLAISHGNQPTEGQSFATISAGNFISASSLGANAGAGSRIVSADGIRITATSGDSSLADLQATNSILVDSGGNLTIGNALVTAPAFESGNRAMGGTITLLAGHTIGRLNPDLPPTDIYQPFDLTITGTVKATANVNLAAGGDVIVGSGANIRSDNRITITSGDDIIVRSGALVRAAEAPLESGYGASGDPRDTPALLSLSAGSLNPIGTPDPTNIAAIIVNGQLAAPGRAISLSGDAIQVRGSGLLSRDLYADVTAPPAPGTSQLNDNGALDAGCVQGNICLTNIQATGMIAIGQGTDRPIAVDLGTGNLAAQQIAVSARQTIRLGQVGSTSSYNGSTSLKLDSLGNVELVGNTNVSGGVLQILAGGDLLGTGNLSSAGDVGITVGGSVNANSIIAGGEITTAANVGGPLEGLYSVAGDFRVGTVGVGASLFALDTGGAITIGSTAGGFSVDLSATGGAYLGTANSNGQISIQGDGVGFDTLSAVNGISLFGQNNSVSGNALNAQSISIQGDTIGVTRISGGSAELTSSFFTNVRTVDLTGDFSAVAFSGDIFLGTVTANGGVGLDGGVISFDSITTNGAFSVSGGGLFGGTVSAGTLASFTIGEGGISIERVTTTSTETGYGNIVINAGSAVSAGTLDASNTLSVTATGLTGLPSPTARGEGGSVLVAGNNIDLNLSGNGLIASANAGGNIGFTAVGGLEFGTLDAGGNITATAGTTIAGDGATAQGGINLISSGDLQLGTARAVTQHVKLASQNGSVTTGALKADAGSVSILAAQNVSTGQVDALDLFYVGNASQLGTLGNDYDPSTLFFTSPSRIGGNLTVSGPVTARYVALGASGQIGVGTVTPGSYAYIHGGTGLTAGTISGTGFIDLQTISGPIQFTSVRSSSSSISINSGGAVSGGAVAGLFNFSINAAGNITLDSATSDRSSGDLTAGGTITVGQVSTARSFSASAGGNATFDRIATTGVGITSGFGQASIDISANGSIDIGSAAARGNIALAAGVGTTGAGTQTIVIDSASAGGDFSADSAGLITLGDIVTRGELESGYGGEGGISSSDISIASRRGVSIASATAAQDLVVNSAGIFTATGALGAGHDIDVTARATTLTTANAANDLRFNINGPLTGQTLAAGNAANVRVLGLINLNGATAGTTLTIDAAGGGGGLTIGTASAGTDATLKSTGLLTLGTGTSGGTFGVTATGAIDIGTLTSQGLATVTGGNAVTIDAINTAVGGTFTAATDLTVGGLSSGGLLTLNGFNVTVLSDITNLNDLAINTQNDLNLQNVTLAGNFGVTVPGMLTARTIRSGGGISVNATGGIGVDAFNAAGALSLTTDGRLTSAPNPTARGEGGVVLVAGAGMDINSNEALIASANAGGNINILTRANLQFGTLDAGGNIGIRSFGGVAGDSSRSVGTLTVRSFSDIDITTITTTGNSAGYGGDVSLTNDIRDIVVGTSTTAGSFSATAANGSVRLGNIQTLGNEFGYGANIDALAFFVVTADSLDAADMIGINSPSIVVNSVKAGGDINLTVDFLRLDSANAGGAFSVLRGIEYTGPSVEIGTLKAQGFASVSNGGPVTIDAINTPAGGTFTSDDRLTLGGVNSGGLLTLNGLFVNVLSDITNANDLTITSESDVTLQNVTLAGNLNVTGFGPITAPSISSGGAITVNIGGGINVGKFDAGSALSLTTSRELTGAPTVPGRVVLIAGTDMNIDADFALVESANAGRDINITTQAGLDFGALAAGRNIAVRNVLGFPGFADVSGGSITSVGTTTVRAGGSMDIGSITTTGNSAGFGGDVSLTADNGDIIVGTGTVAGGFLATAANGAVSLGSIATSGNEFGYGAGITVNAGGALTGGSLDAADGISVNTASANLTSVAAGGNIGFTTTGGLVLGSANAGGTFTVSAGDPVDIGTLTAQGFASVSGGGAVTIDAINTAVGGNFAAVGDLIVGGLNSGGLLRLSGFNVTVLSDIVDGNADDLAITTQNDLTLQNVTLSGTFSVSAPGTLTAQTIRSGDSIFVNAGAIDLAGAFAARTVRLTATGAIRVDSGEAGYDFLVDAGTDVSLGSIVTTGAESGYGGEGGDGLSNIGISAGGNVAAGSLNAHDALSITADGRLAGLPNPAARGEGGSILVAGTGMDINSGDALIATANAGRDINIATRNDLEFGMLNAGRSIGIRAFGSVLGDSSTSVGTTTVRAANTIDISTITTTGGPNTLFSDVSLIADNGDIIVGTANVVGNFSATAEDNIDLGGITTTANEFGYGAGITVDAGGALTGGTLDAADGIGVDAASANLTGVKAGGDIDFTTTGGLMLGSADAGGGFTATAGDPVDIGTLTSKGFAAVNGGGAVTIDAINTPIGGTFTAAGDLTVGGLNSGGLLTLNGFNVTVLSDITDADSLAITTQNDLNLQNVTLTGGFDVTVPGTLTAKTISSGDSIFIDAGTIDLVGAFARRTVDLRATKSVSVDSGEAGGDFLITAGGDVSLGEIVTTGAEAGYGGEGGQGGSILIRSTGGLVTATKATAFGAIGIEAAGNVSGGDFTAGSSLTVTSGGSFTATAASATGATGNGNGNVTINAATGIAVEQVNAAGDASLTAQNGDIVVARDLAVGGVTSALGRSIQLNALGGLRVRSATATAGGLAVTTGGDLLIDAGSATGNIALTSDGGTINVGTLTDGAEIRLRSNDIVIASNGQLGTIGKTTLVDLTNNGRGRTFVGGNGGNGGYDLSATELARIFSGDIFIHAPLAGGQGAESVGSTRAPDVVVGSFTLSSRASNSNGNLAADGTFGIDTPGKLRVVGDAAFTGMGNDNRVELTATDAIEVDTAGGSIALNGANGLAGTLALKSDDIFVGTLGALADIATAVDTDAINDRLALNDGLASETGRIQAGGLEVDAGNGFYVQNTGIEGNNLADRRGFTVGSGGLTVRTGSASTRIVINGRQVDPAVAGQFITGIDLIERVRILGPDGQPTGTAFDQRSTINGCLIASVATCRITLPFPVQDIIEEVNDPARVTVRPAASPLVELRDFDRVGFQPLIDEPVTGAGNDDLWNQPCVVTPGDPACLPDADKK